MKTVKCLIIKLIFLAILFPIGAQSGESEYEIDGEVFSTTSRNEQISEANITVLGFKIGQHSLRDIQERLGHTRILERKEQGPVQICYRSNRSTDRTLVVFEADAMGGWQDLTAISFFSKAESFPQYKKCVKSHLISKSLQTKSGLTVGMTHKELKSILGVATKTMNNDLFYIYETSRKMTTDEINKLGLQQADVERDAYWDEFSYVHARFVDDKITYLSISKVISH